MLPITGFPSWGQSMTLGDKIKNMAFGPCQQYLSNMILNPCSLIFGKEGQIKLSYLPYVACLSELGYKQDEIGRQRKQGKEAGKGKGKRKYEEPRKAGRHKPIGKERSYTKLTRKLWVSWVSKLELIPNPEGKTTHNLKNLSIRQTRRKKKKGRWLEREGASTKRHKKPCESPNPLAHTHSYLEMGLQILAHRLLFARLYLWNRFHVCRQR